MKRFFHFLRFAALILLPIIAAASGTTANVSWTAPTQYVDGTALPSTDIDHYTVTWSPAAGQTGVSGSLNVAGNATLPVPVPVACGNTTFTVTVTTTTSAKYPSTTSGPSSAVPYATGVQCSPKVVTGVTVT